MFRREFLTLFGEIILGKISWLLIKSIFLFRDFFFCFKAFLGCDKNSILWESGICLGRWDLDSFGEGETGLVLYLLFSFLPLKGVGEKPGFFTSFFSQCKDPVLFLWDILLSVLLKCLWESNHPSYFVSFPVERFRFKEVKFFLF